MASERWWRKSSQLFLTNGTSLGVLTVSNIRGFKVKAEVIISSTSQPDLIGEIKSIPDCNTIIVGPCGASMDTRLNLSLYLVADAATILQPRQKRPAIGPGEIDRAVYEEEPVVARRIIMVDECGDPYSDVNPLPTSASISATFVDPAETTPGSVIPAQIIALGAKDRDTGLLQSLTIDDKDRLRVNASLTMTNQFRIHTNITNVALNSVTYTTLYTRTGTGLFFGFQTAFDVPDIDIRLTVDTGVVFVINLITIRQFQFNDTTAARMQAGSFLTTINNVLDFSAKFPIPYLTDIKIDARTSDASAHFNTNWIIFITEDS